MNGFSEYFYNTSPIFLQNLLVSVYGYKLYRKRYKGKIFNKVRCDIERTNAMSANEQNEFQAERLHEMIKHCRVNVPYYKNLLAELDLTEQDFTETNHLTKLPILNKKQIRETPELFQAKGTKPYMIQKTSGSTGTPLSLWVDEYTYKLAMALLIDHEERHGVAFGARRATFAGRMIQPISNMSPPFSRLNLAENQRLYSAYHINSDTFPHYDRDLQKFQAEEFIGYPSAIYDMAMQYKRHNIKPKFQPNAIITNSETLLEWQRDTIESVFNCKIYDYYGTAEYVTFAGQCTQGNYHFNPLIGITEVVRQEESENGNIGQDRIIASTLTNTIMPLLRYQIGDTASQLQSQCGCFQLNKNVCKIFGREDDVIETSDGRNIGRIGQIFQGLSGIKEAQVVQSRPGQATIKIVRDHTKSDNPELLNRNAKLRLGRDFSISVKYVKYIPRGKNGKFKFIERK